MSPLLPEFALLATAVCQFLSDAFLPTWRDSRKNLILVALGAIASAGLAFIQWDNAPAIWRGGLVTVDHLTQLFRILNSVALLSSAAMLLATHSIAPRDRSELLILLVIATLGLNLMAMASHVLMLILGIETVSLASYVLVGANRTNRRSGQAALKYFVFGSLAAAMMLYGAGILALTTSGLEFSSLFAPLDGPLAAPLNRSLILAFGLFFAGLLFKLSAFPMHFWTPDIYQGAPTPVAAFLSLGPKLAAVAALCRIGISGGTGLAPRMQIWLLVGAVGSLTIGNLAALRQTDVKRMLGYSSIAQAGYLLCAATALSERGWTAMVFYCCTYLFMNLGAFWVLNVVEYRTHGTQLANFRGLGWNNPILGVSMGVFLFSLAGIPLFSGFAGKFLIFGALVEQREFAWLALFGVLNSVISLYYYAQVLKAMWLDKPTLGVPAAASIEVGWYHGIALVGLAVPTIALGLFFTPLIRLAERSLGFFR